MLILNAIDHLLPLLNNQYIYVQCTAAEALYKLGKKEVIDHLMAAPLIYIVSKKIVSFKDIILHQKGISMNLFMIFYGTRVRGSNIDFQQMIEKIVVMFKLLIAIGLICHLFTSSLMAHSQNQHMLHMQLKSFDPLISIPEQTLFSGVAVKQSARNERHYYILQFKGPILQKDQNMLSESGISVFDYIPNNAFIVRMSEKIARHIQNNQRVRWIGDYAPQFRVAPDVIEQVSTTSPKQSFEKTLNLRVTFFPGEPLSDIVTELSKLGTIVNQYVTQFRTSIQLKIVSAKVPDLCRMQGIQWISKMPNWQLMNNVASIIVNINDARNNFGLYGEGQIVAVCDTGLDQGKKTPESLHDDFEDGKGQSRINEIFNLTPVMFNDEPDDIFSGHGTHVAGIILGNGYLSGSQPQLDHFPQTAYAGIAPKASLVFQAAEDSSTGILLGLMLDLNQIFGQAYFAGARIHSNSWGAASGSTYASECMDVDQFMWDHKDFLIVFAAGNSGIDMDHDGFIDPYSICSPGASKNCVTVGGSESLRFGEGYTCSWGTCWPNLFAIDPIASDNISDNSDGMAAFSSRGPTLDGRYKPDIVAPATNIMSVRSSKASYEGWGYSPDEHYMFMGGTSMATPIVSGTAALIREYLIKSGISQPSSALIKATLLNTADHMGSGQYGNHTPPEIPLITPNNVNGWGRVNLGNGIYPESPISIIYKDNEDLETNQTITYTFEVIDSQYPLKINLVWTDYPGSPAAQGGLVNDIDCYMTGPFDNQKYYPDGANNQSSIQTLQYDMNFPIFQSDANQCAMRFTPENDSCILDAVSISIANPNDVQDDIWIRVYEYNSFELKYKKQYHYLPSGWTTLPINHIEMKNNEFIIAIEKTSPEITISSDMFNLSNRGLIKQNDKWVPSSESFYIRAYVRQQEESLSYDRVNNCLGFYLKTPEKGFYQLHISGYNVPKGPQPFALIARGAIQESLPQKNLNVFIPEKVNEGDGILKDNGMVSIPNPIEKKLIVYLSSSDETEIVVPPSVDIPAGQTKAHFDIQIVEDTSNDGSQTVIIEANAEGFLPASTTVIVEDNDTIPVLVVTPNTFSAPYDEGDAVFTITNAGSGQMKWHASVDCQWLSIVGGNSGVNGGNIKIHYQKNTTNHNREGHLIVHVTDYKDLTQTILIHQKNEQIEIILSPEDGQKYDYFGYSTSLWNNIAVIGAYRHGMTKANSGAAYIYQYDELSWKPRQIIYAKDGLEGDYFGYAVSVFDTQIAIGAYKVDDLGTSSGAAYIFEQKDNQWIETAKLLASDGKRSDYFGCSVDMFHDQLVAGAYKSDVIAKDAGAAYVFEKDEGQWSEKCCLVPKQLKRYDYFGHAVAIHDGYIIVGAYGDDESGYASGSAYIFENTDGNWKEKEKLCPEPANKYDYCGYSVDISSQYAVIGAYKSDSVGPDSGAAYVYEKKEGKWIQTAVLKPWKSTAYDYFGASVSLDGEFIIVGAYGDDSKGKLAGAAYVFKFINGFWQQFSYLRASDGQTNHLFGTSVSISKNGEALIGAYGNDAKGYKSGAAYIYSVFSMQASSKPTLALSPFGSISWEKQNQQRISNNDCKKEKPHSSQFNYIKQHQTFTTERPSIVYTQIPEMDNRIKNLKGRINYPYPNDLTITTYIFYNNLWHLKAFSYPLSDTGSFNIDITTDPGDHMATSIAIFVLPQHQTIEWPDNVSLIPQTWSEISYRWDMINR